MSRASRWRWPFGFAVRVDALPTWRLREIGSFSVARVQPMRFVPLAFFARARPCYLKLHECPSLPSSCIGCWVEARREPREVGVRLSCRLLSGRSSTA